MATDNSSNLPGVKVTYEDGSLYGGNSQLGSTTQSMLILGSAVDGPTGDPINVAQVGVKAVEKMLGGMVVRGTREPNGASLVRAMNEALGAGNDDVRVLRIDGTPAQTTLKAKDLARSTEQYLDKAAGNTAFAADLQIPVGGVFVGQVSVAEIDKTTGASKTIANAVRNVESNVPGAEKAYMYADRMRPGNSAKLTFDYETYQYTGVPKQDNQGAPDYTDVDYTLTRDGANNHYFYSARKNWSSKLESGHIPVVVVKDNGTGIVSTISSTTPSGDLIYRVGKGFNKTNPLTDIVTEADYKEGGLFFTAAYDAEVAKGTYPDITGNVTVTVEYTWYNSFSNQGETTIVVPGQDTSYNLNFTPQSSEFSVYYMNGADKVVVDKASYTIEIANKVVTIKAGEVPVGVDLYASYKTSSSTATDPTITIFGKYDGEVYGTLEDLFDPKSIKGVQVEITLDPSDASGTEKIITFHKPVEKRTTSQDTKVVYETAKLKNRNVRTLRQFTQLVNTDPANNVVRIYTPNEFGSIAVQGLLVTAPVFLGEESPGVVKEDPSKPLGTAARYPWIGGNGIFDPSNQEQMLALYEKLGSTYEVDQDGESKMITQGVYSRLENYAVDVIVLADAYANTIVDPFAPEKNFATQLAQHCAVVTAKTWETVGAIAMAPSLDSSLLSVQEYVDLATGRDIVLRPGVEDEYKNAGVDIKYVNQHDMYNEATMEKVLNESGATIDIGRYVNVVFGPEVGLSSDKVGNYVAPGGVVYGALITTLSAEVATTNKVMPSVYGLRYRLSEPQHNQLIGAKYVTFDSKAFSSSGASGTQIAVKDGVTAARPDSDYGRLSTVRITHAAVQVIRRRADAYIGLPNGIAQQNALSAEIQAGLDLMKQQGALQRFSFTLFASTQDKVLGNGFIALELVPQFELRKLNTSVVLKAS